MRRLLFVLIAACSGSATPVATAPKPEAKELASPLEQHHLQGLKQLTFGGDNAEAYWSFAGDKLIFQTNHKPYQCDQIEEMPSTGGASKLISNGKGRQTCSYFLKGDQQIIYASTDENAPECPTPPDMSKGYTWGLFEYDIYKANADGTNRTKLAGGSGYDAEATVCPKDGSIIFTSQRSGDLDLWRMDADGSNLRQLTNSIGYDGGAFFSADCSKIVWRASRPQPGPELDDYKALYAQHLVKPNKMNLWVANADGTEARQVTYLPGASFAPYFFPNGKRIVFGSNYLSPRSGDFDLFAVDIDGTHLERITDDGSFDGFPVFSPDGKTLSFSSGRRDTIKVGEGSGATETWRMTGTPADAHGINVFTAQWTDSGTPQYQPESAMADEYRTLIDYLADDAREGRGIGTKGLADAADYVQKQFADSGVEPGGDAGAWRQTFEVTTDVTRGDKTSVAIDGKPVAADAFAPMPFSSQAPVTGAIVDMGWGIADEVIKRDDYKGKSVKGKIVLVHRFAPSDPTGDAVAIAAAGDLRKKAFVAHNHGAIGMIVVDDGDPKQDEAPLPTLSPESAGQHGDSGMPIVVVKRAAIGKAPKTATITVALQTVRAPTDNVIGIIRSTAPNKLPGAIILGAHLDHLGMGGGGNALDPTVHAVHNGADDNASGVAALIEAAQILAKQKSTLQRDIYVIAFSGEEEGDLGSDFYTKHADMKNIVAMINMDMVGRMRNNHLVVNGGESATEWRDLVQPACDAAKVECSIGGSGYGPSDHMSFYIAGVPVLFLFTGNHLDYHTATDDPEKINAIGGSRVATIAADVAARVANRPGALSYVKAPPEQTFGDIRQTGASLGTVPSYSEDPNQPPGVQLSDVVPGGAAAKAGLKGGDRIIKVGSLDIRGINDLMFVLQSAKPGTETKIIFVRDGKEQSVTATFGVPRGRK
jgi:membrane-associated protease RseP (regulator of RpoE activity)